MYTTRRILEDFLAATNLLHRHVLHALLPLTWLCLQDDLVDEVADLNTVPNEKQELDITAGISNSFGFGGHNSVVAFAPFKQ